MKVTDLRKLLADVPGNRECRLSLWNGEKTELFYVGVACNLEHQRKRKELWFTQGIRAEKQ